MVLSDSDDEKEEEKKPEGGEGAAAAGASPSKRRQAVRGAADEALDVDANAEDKAPTYLMQQPPSISGGTMRSYQLEGLNWMINLQAQGTNGEHPRRMF